MHYMAYCAFCAERNGQVDLTQLVYFVEIAKLQNVTKAAERLHIAQPALSQSLQKLEQELGTKLFDRIGKSIRLNEDGRIMFRYSEQILELYHNAREELADRLKSETGTIKLKFLCASDLIPDIIASFQSLYPGIGFKIVQSSELMDYDFCITSTYNNVTPENGRLLHDEEILLAVPPNHRFARRKRCRLEELKEDPFISLDANKQLRKLTDTFCKAVNFRPNIALECDNPALVRNLIAAELGVAFVPADTWEQINNDRIGYLHIERPVCVRSIFITWPQNKYISRQGYFFLNFIQDYFKNRHWLMRGEKGR